MCWRTYFLRRMESLAKGTHYNICACARKGNSGRGKENTEIRKGIAWHPGLDMFDIRVSACSTSGSRYARHPGVGHKIKANGRNDTGRKQYRNMQRKEIQTENGREKDTKKQRHSKKEQTQEIGERRQAARKTRSKPQPDKPVKGRRTLY